MKVAAKWTFAFLLLGLGVAADAAKQFVPVVYYSVGTNPYQTISGQFTNSGNLDLAIADYPGGGVSILLGRGDGTFKKPLTFSAPSAAALVGGDFNGDGNMDLAVVEYGGTGESILAIFLGDGTGKFHQSTSYKSGIETTSVAAADFDGDGILDLVVANNAGNVMVFPGTGKGTFKKPTTYQIGSTPWAVAVGDLNGDHYPDLAVTNISGFVSVLLNDGSGKFSTPIGYDAGGGEIVDVEIADLRHNGDEDLVVANASRGMVVLLNNGNGSFGTPSVYTPSFFNAQAPQACTVADFNLDGILDVACAATIDDSYFFYGKGDGTFGPSVRIHNTIDYKGGFSIATGDFNNDKTPDLAIPIWTKDKVAIMINAQ